jgi:NTP pyrophosphatase (non-canonical NTP hydrolase)
VSERNLRLMKRAALALEAQDDALERRRDGRLRYVADDPDCPDLLRLAALTEELGEIARCLHDGEGDLSEELSQLAGIALAWGSIL